MKNNPLRYFLCITILFSISANAQINLCTSLNGTNDYFEVPDNSTMDITGNFTIEAWINLCDMNIYRTIVSKNFCSGAQGGYHFGVINGQLRFAWVTNGNCNYVNSYVSDNAIINSQVWTHVSVVHTNTDVTLFVNGSPVSGSLIAGSHGPIYSNTTPFRIGVYQGLSGSLGNYFSGMIDEISIWNIALSGSTISSTYQSALIGNETGLIAYYSMESTSGAGTGAILSNTATVSGTQNNATASGTVTTPYFDNGLSYTCPVTSSESKNNILNASAYPNPFSGEIKLNIDNKTGGLINVSVFDSFGRNVQNLEYIWSDESIDLNLSDQESGCYFIKVVQGNRSGHVMVMKRE